MGNQVPGVPDAVQIQPAMTYLLLALPSSVGVLLRTVSPCAHSPVVGAAVIAPCETAMRPSVTPLSCRAMLAKSVLIETVNVGPVAGGTAGSS